MKKILITGISGFIGNYLYKYRPVDVEITGTFFKTKIELPEIEIVSLDLLQVDDFITNIKQKFDVVIHCAAESNLAECEKNPQKAFDINSNATRKLAQWSKEQKSRFIFLSTDIVFDGEKGNYSEYDSPQPINIYGKSKLEAERLILNSHENAVIARLALCLGKGLGAKTGFLDWLLSKLENDEPIPLYYDEYRTPVSAKVTALLIWQLAIINFTGIFHLAGIDKINRYDLAVKIFEYLKSEKNYLLKKETSETSLYPRPKDVSLQSNFFSKFQNIQQENISSLIRNIL